MRHDRLTISDLELWTRIGVTAGEREAEQRILISIVMTLDVAKAAEHDDVKDTIDYLAVRNAILDLGRIGRKTVERLAEDIATLILERFKPDSVEVAVKKFPFSATREVSIRIQRNREHSSS
ncbi:dihydroneopterin aldolase [Candidatus Peregrinibacteria bacterium]|nr:dihydroneopterin aldolase [Candidatus Peregrinibacteria bacterium]MBI3816882.1 dihydroneopterin aldolase [Candidatus Peregrinibacteria bacterium]